MTPVVTKDLNRISRFDRSTDLAGLVNARSITDFKVSERKESDSLLPKLLR